MSKYLIISGTSRSREGAFSAADNIVSAKGNYLDPKNIGKLVFLSQKC